MQHDVTGGAAHVAHDPVGRLVQRFDVVVGDQVLFLAGGAVDDEHVCIVRSNRRKEKR